MGSKAVFNINTSATFADLLSGHYSHKINLGLIVDTIFPEQSRFELNDDIVALSPTLYPRPSYFARIISGSIREKIRNHYDGAGVKEDHINKKYLLCLRTIVKSMESQIPQLDAAAQPYFKSALRYFMRETNLQPQPKQA